MVGMGMVEVRRERCGGGLPGGYVFSEVVGGGWVQGECGVRLDGPREVLVHVGGGERVGGRRWSGWVAGWMSYVGYVVCVVCVVCWWVEWAAQGGLAGGRRLVVIDVQRVSGRKWVDE